MVNVKFLVKNENQSQPIEIDCDLQEDEIGEIKEKIEVKLGHDKHRQRFLLDGKELPNDDTLLDHGYTSDKTIEVIITPPKTIDVIGDDGTRQFDFDAYESVGELKRRIADEWDVEEYRVDLFNWRNVKLVKKHSRVCDYDIDSNDTKKRKITLRILPRNTISIFIQSTHGGAVRLRIRDTATVRELKEECTAFESRSIEEMRFMFRGLNLNDEHVLKDKGIVDGSTVYSQKFAEGGKFLTSDF